MAKITIDTKGLITSEEDVQKAFQVATKAYHLLKEGGEAMGHGYSFLDMVEIIKVTTWTEELGGEPVHRAEFQIVYNIPFLSYPTKEEKLKIVAEWDSRVKYDVEVRKDEPYTGEYIGGISLQDAEIKTLARALIRAIQMGFEYRRSHLERLITRLSEAEEYLNSLIKAPAKS